MPESAERGALTEAVFYIMLSLYRPMHGYGIMQNVKELSRGRVMLGAGTLYGAINTLVEKGWISNFTNTESRENARKKEYMITEKGQLVILDELDRLEELLENGRIIAGGTVTDTYDAGFYRGNGNPFGGDKP